MKGVYAFPKFSVGDNFGLRIGGAGLGNLLFTFARAAIYSNRKKIPLINPTWPNIKLGPFIRMEKDKRLYFDLFKSIGISGVRKLVLLNSLKHVKESQLETLDQVSDNTVIDFEGLGNYFEDIKCDHEFIKSTLYSVIKPKHLTGIDNLNQSFIGVHLRLGDFSESARLSIDWCIDLVSELRKMLGENYPVLIFSDGKDSEMSELLKLNFVSRIYTGSSLSDILALSKSKVLIASNSTFSGWASYLGRMPVIYQSRHFPPLYYEEGEIELVLERPNNLNTLLPFL